MRSSCKFHGGVGHVTSVQHQQPHGNLLAADPAPSQTFAETNHSCLGAHPVEPVGGLPQVFLDVFETYIPRSVTRQPHVTMQLPGQAHVQPCSSIRLFDRPRITPEPERKANDSPTCGSSSDCPARSEHFVTSARNEPLTLPVSSHKASQSPCATAPIALSSQPKPPNLSHDVQACTHRLYAGALTNSR